MILVVGATGKIARGPRERGDSVRHSFAATRTRRRSRMVASRWPIGDLRPCASSCGDPATRTLNPEFRRFQRALSQTRLKPQASDQSPT